MKRILLAPVIVVLAVLSSCSSCAMNPEVLELWGGEVIVPRFLGLEPQSASTVLARFSAPVSAREASVILTSAGGDPLSATGNPGGEENSLLFTIGEPLEIGTPAVLSAVVEDANGDTLSFAVPFIGYNDRPARLLINEIRTNYAKPKVEYVEFYTVGAGNLAGVEVVNSMNATDSSYEFPAVEVRRGDYIVYHLRSVEEGLVDETDSVDASAGIDARVGGRDFWDTLSKAPLKPTNALLVRERKGGPIMDALLCAEEGTDSWPTDAVRLAAEEAFAAGAWNPGPAVSDAVRVTGMTATRTLGRNTASDDTDTAADWRVCAKGKCSPGDVNAPQ